MFSKSQHEKSFFWALENVSFSIDKGDTVGIIGRNGAGKSTLLKILSRITAPTKGNFQLNGRVSSLLEVGTGFHPELTGRENIYLNGTILGMSRSEVKRKFDEIVDFSGVEKFLDTPIKKYSSGMTVRLAFSVAAHLDPEILIVDEVLAVGDAEFQKKCLGKMKEVSNNEGRTVLFVSHNLGAVMQLCQSGILLENGKLKIQGKTNDVIASYLASSTEQVAVMDRRETAEWKNRNHFISFSMLGEKNEATSEFKHNEIITLSVKMHVPAYHPSLELAISVYDKLKNRVFTIHEKLSQFEKENETISLKVTLPAVFLTPGNYSWLMCFSHQSVEIQDLQDDFYPFTIIDSGSSFSAYTPGSYGNVFVKYSVVQK
ncbi:MAG: ABC transporter ATP-binding protein [Bacteroidia bacterium]|nr:ABC transporter ATP-binding protein [Bacteroidia bacterium]